jgi:hypothetical protein
MKLRNIALDLLGVAVLVLKGRYSGPGELFIGAYAGNISVSFALYFVAMFLMRPSPRGRASAALVVLASVTLFEITDGFGVMANVYDALDLVANAAGICLAVVVDLLTARFVDGSSRASSAVV